jgi:hypothetical protein
MIPLYRRFCDGWALERLTKLPTFLLALRNAGFCDIRVEDISWRIMPSAAFIPIAASRMLRQRFKEAESRLTPRQWAHLTAPFAIPAFAAFPHRFGYFLITATKPG